MTEGSVVFEPAVVSLEALATLGEIAANNANLFVGWAHRF